MFLKNAAQKLKAELKLSTLYGLIYPEMIFLILNTQKNNLSDFY